MPLKVNDKKVVKPSVLGDLKVSDMFVVNGSQEYGIVGEGNTILWIGGKNETWEPHKGLFKNTDAEIRNTEITKLDRLEITT